MLASMHSVIVSRNSPSIMALRQEWRDQYDPSSQSLNFRAWICRKLGTISISSVVMLTEDGGVVHHYQLCWEKEIDMVHTVMSYDLVILSKDSNTWG